MRKTSQIYLMGFAIFYDKKQIFIAVCYNLITKVEKYLEVVIFEISADEFGDLRWIRSGFHVFLHIDSRILKHMVLCFNNTI